MTRSVCLKIPTFDSPCLARYGGKWFFFRVQILIDYLLFFFRGALCNILFHRGTVPILTLWQAYQVNGVQFHQKVTAKIPATLLFRQQVVQASPCYGHFVRRNSDDRWISPHKGSVMQKTFPVMTSSYLFFRPSGQRLDVNTTFSCQIDV